MRKNCDTCKSGRDKSIMANSPVWCRIDDLRHNAWDCCPKWEGMTTRDIDNAADLNFKGKPQ
jgi:hypothetical protein